MKRRHEQSNDPTTTLTVRLPRSLVEDIDRNRQDRAVHVPRNTWIAEAVVEKLDRAQDGKSDRGHKNGERDGSR